MPSSTLTILLGFLLPWTWDISLRHSSKVQLLFLTLDEGYLLTATPPDLERGIAPLGPPAPVQPPLLVLNKVSPQKKLFNQSPTYLEKGKYPVPAYSSHPVSLRGGGKKT